MGKVKREYYREEVSSYGYTSEVSDTSGGDGGGGGQGGSGSSSATPSSDSDSSSNSASTSEQEQRRRKHLKRKSSHKSGRREKRSRREASDWSGEEDEEEEEDDELAERERKRSKHSRHRNGEDKYYTEGYGGAEKKHHRSSRKHKHRHHHRRKHKHKHRRHRRRERASEDHRGRRGEADNHKYKERLEYDKGDRERRAGDRLTEKKERVDDRREKTEERKQRDKHDRRPGRNKWEDEVSEEYNPVRPIKPDPDAAEGPGPPPAGTLDSQPPTQRRSRETDEERLEQPLARDQSKWETVQVKEDGGTPAAEGGEEDKHKPNLALTGKLSEDTNTYNGVVIKYSQPPEARKPKRRWRWYIFKGDEDLPFLPLHRQSAYLIGRDRKVADIPTDHPSCSKQHAVLQYRLVSYARPGGTKGRTVKPYLLDLESANGTYVNNRRIESKCFVELLEKDVVKFGYSSREYILLHEGSKGDEDMVPDTGVELSPVSLLRS